MKANLPKKASFSALLTILSLGILLGLNQSCGNKNPRNKLLLSEKNPIIGGVPLTAKGHFGLVDYKLQLKQEAFGHTFLLNTAVIKGPPTPSGTAFANKLVYFKRRGGSVGLFERLDGQLSVSRASLETEVLLAEFPVIDNYEDGAVLIDFNKGMKLFYSKDGMVASDYPQGGESAKPVAFSYVRDAYLKDRYFYISQVARVNNKPQEIRYSLSSYQPNKNFVPKKSNLNKSVGYFEIPKVITEGTGEETFYITKFDLSKKITFYLTRNIPEDYYQAVTDGVLYWNKTYGKEVLEVKKLPVGVSIHEPGYNVVQWLDWDSAGFAYANLHADPLTGETLQAFVYMTSVFAKGGLNRAKSLLRKYGAQNYEAPATDDQLVIPGFEKNQAVCSKDPKWAMTTAMRDLSRVVNELDSDETLTKEEKEALYLRFSQDYVRETVAHEIGHALGLRHNFAGSLANTVKPKFYDQLAKLYFFTGELPNGQIANASVMDYTPGVLAAMLGQHIRSKASALPYDAKAIEWGYSDKTVDQLNIPTFCTDSKASGKYADCLRFDYFADIIEGSHKVWKDALSDHAFSILSKFNFLNDEDYKKKGHSQARVLRDVLNVSLNPVSAANNFVKAKNTVLELATSKKELIQIRKKYPETMTLLDEEEYQQELFEYKTRGFEKLGGFSKVFFEGLEFSESLTSSSPFHLESVNLIWSKYQQLSEKKFETIDPIISEKITDRVKEYLSILEKEYLVAELNKLKGLKPIIKDESFPESLKSFAEKVLFLQTENIVGTIGTMDQPASIQEYYFNYERKAGTKTYDVRKLVVEVLKADYYPGYPSFGRTMKPLKKSVKATHDAVVKGITDITKEDDLSPEIFDWLVAEKKRFSGL